MTSYRDLIGQCFENEKGELHRIDDIELVNVVNDKETYKVNLLAVHRYKDELLYYGRERLWLSDLTDLGKEFPKSEFEKIIKGVKPHIEPLK